MTKSKLRKIAIVLSALAVLNGGFGIDSAYAGGGGGFGAGGFGGGHIGGLGGGHIGGFGGDHIGSEFGAGHLSGGFGREHIGGGGGLMGGAGIANLRGNPLGTALAGVHAASFGQLRHRRTPAVVWGAAPWYNAYDAVWDSGFDAPPWYGGSDAPSYDGSGLPWYGGGENPTYAVPGRNPSDTTNRNATCRTQTYQVRSAEDGGERAVNIVRC